MGSLRAWPSLFGPHIDPPTEGFNPYLIDALD